MTGVVHCMICNCLLGWMSSWYLYHLSKKKKSSWYLYLLAPWFGLLCLTFFSNIECMSLGDCSSKCQWCGSWWTRGQQTSKCSCYCLVQLFQVWLSVANFLLYQPVGSIPFSNWTEVLVFFKITQRINLSFSKSKWDFDGELTCFVKVSLHNLSVIQ